MVSFDSLHVSLYLLKKGEIRAKEKPVSFSSNEQHLRSYNVI